MEILYYILRQPRLREDRMDLLSNRRGLRGGFNDDGIPRQQSGYKGIDKDEVWIL